MRFIVKYALLHNWLYSFLLPPKGIMEADSEPYISTEKIFDTTGFTDKETFPNRVKVKPQLIPDNPVSFKELVPKLKFIKPKN